MGEIHLIGSAGLKNPKNWSILIAENIVQLLHQNKSQSLWPLSKLTLSSLKSLS